MAEALRSRDDGHIGGRYAQCTDPTRHNVHTNAQCIQGSSTLCIVPTFSRVSTHTCTASIDTILYSIYASSTLLLAILFGWSS